MKTVEEILHEAELEAEEREMRRRAVMALERIADALERAPGSQGALEEEEERRSNEDKKY